MTRREKFLKEIIRKAGKIVLAGFEKSEVRYTKHDRLDIVTDVDLESNDFIVSRINEEFPEDEIISEEIKGDLVGEDYTWIIDPLDGTVNFSTGIPIFVVMIALVKNGEVVMSAIFDPIHEKFAFAKKGYGAFVNGKRINCSNNDSMISSRGLMSFVVKEQEVYIREKIVEKGNQSNVQMEVNAFGCAGFNALCVANGNREWIIGFNHKLWDVAPGALLLLESGCEVTGYKGEKWKLGMSLVAANKKLHKELVKLTSVL